MVMVLQAHCAHVDRGRYTGPQWELTQWFPYMHLMHQAAAVPLRVHRRASQLTRHGQQRGLHM